MLINFGKRLRGVKQMIEAFGIALLAMIVGMAIYPFTHENANDQARVLWEQGVRARVVKKWWGWTIDGEYK